MTSEDKGDADQEEWQPKNHQDRAAYLREQARWLIAEVKRRCAPLIVPLRHADRFLTKHDAAITAFSTAIMAGFTVALFLVSKEQGRLSEQALVESQRTNDLARLALEVQQQPWVFVSDMKKTKEFKPLSSDGEIVITTSVAGATPALDKEAFGMIELVREGERPSFSYGLITTKASIQVQAPGQGNIMALFFDEQSTPGLAVDDATQDLYLFGYIRYRDRFGKLYCSQFCSQAYPILGKSDFVSCTSYNKWSSIESADQCPIGGEQSLWADNTE